MPPLIALVLICLGAAAYATNAATAKRVLVMRPDDAPREPGAAARFTGDAHVTSRFNATDGSRLTGALVHFANGARTAWHTHPHGQTLVVTSGCGWVQQEGGTKQSIRPGDIIWTPPGVKHWHGAATDASMSHATLIERVDQTEVVWMEKVTAAELGDGACPGRRD